MWMRVTWFCVTGHLTNIGSWRDKINQIQMTFIRKAEFYIILNNANNNNWHLLNNYYMPHTLTALYVLSHQSFAFGGHLSIWGFYAEWKNEN